MKMIHWLAILGLGLLFAGCASMDAEERDFYTRGVVHPGVDAEDRAFWYDWMKPGGMRP